MPQCKHKNIVITRKSRYFSEKGFLNEFEDDNLDLGKHFIEEEQTSVLCEDCGEYLDE